jgi:threonine dehydrogenase-like Zn-dependent dehydrogenase
MELTRGEGSHIVIEAVGLMPAYQQAYGIVRPGGVISRVGVPQYEDAPVGFGAALTAGVAPVEVRIGYPRTLNTLAAINEVAPAASKGN